MNNCPNHTRHTIALFTKVVLDALALEVGNRRTPAQVVPLDLRASPLALECSLGIPAPRTDPHQDAAGYLHRFDRGSDGRYFEAAPVRLGQSLDSLMLLEDGSLVAGGASGLVERLLPQGGRIAFRFHRVRVRSIASTSLDGQPLLATGDYEGTICLWRLDGRLERAIEFEHGAVNSLQFSPDGEQLLSGTGDGTARIWPVRTGDLLALARRRVR